MDTTSPHPRPWYVHCDGCNGTGKVEGEYTPGFHDCFKCGGSGVLKIMEYARFPDPRKIAMRRLGLMFCALVAGLAVYLIFFGN